jgi:DNA-binding CsgD family transcriptional regulator
VLDAVHELAAVEQIDELPTIATRLAFGLVQSEWCGWVTVDFDRGTLEAVHWPQDYGQFEGITAADFLDIPLVEAVLNHLSAEVITLSDIWTRNEWHRTRMYTEIYAPEGVEYQILAPMSFVDPTLAPRGARIEGITLVRSNRDYTPRDRVVLTEFSRHVRAAARRLSGSAWRAERDAAVRLGLTARQAEALLAVADGSTMRAAATRVGVTPKTLENHLQAAYSKLAVNNRVAALARLREPEVARFAVGEIPH